jgi:acylphosphatase
VSEDVAALDLVVTGRVQGVFYRASMRTEADRLGVSGWVRNADDGTVRAHLEGFPAALEELLAWCRTGPPRAQVEDVRATDAEVTGAEGFED